MFVCCYFVAQSIRFFASQILLFQAASLRSQYMTSPRLMVSALRPMRRQSFADIKHG
jgi:hypothetical protein